MDTEPYRVNSGKIDFVYKQGSSHDIEITNRKCPKCGLFLIHYRFTKLVDLKKHDCTLFEKLFGDCRRYNCFGKFQCSCGFKRIRKL